MKKTSLLVRPAPATLTALTLAVLFSCSSQKGAKKDPGPSQKEPGGGSAPSASKPKPAQKPEPGASQDPATNDFLKAAQAISGDSKGGKVDWGEVADRMKDVTSRHPHYGVAWYNLGLAYEKLGKDEKADAAYRTAIEKSRVKEAYENLAAMVNRKGDSRQARTLLKELVASDVTAANARISLAEGAMVEGDLEEAGRLAVEALGSDPKSVRAYCMLAKISFLAGDILRARLIVSQGLKLKEGSPGCLHSVLGFVLLKEEETAQGIAELERAVKENPAEIEARFRIAQISMGVKDFRKAIDNYLAITQADPMNAAAYLNLGVALKGTGRFPDAEKAYLKAIEVAKDQPIPEGHFNLGVLYLRHLGRLDDAKTQLKRYLQVANSGSDDTAFKMLEEIDQMRAMEEEGKRAEDQATREAEIERKVQAEEAKKKAAEEKPPEDKSKDAPKDAPKTKPKPSDEPQDPNDPTPSIAPKS